MTIVYFDGICNLIDLHEFYDGVKIYSPLEPDIEGDGVPSDHNTAVLNVATCREESKVNYVTKSCTKRRIFFCCWRKCVSNVHTCI